MTKRSKMKLAAVALLVLASTAFNGPPANGADPIQGLTPSEDFAERYPEGFIAEDDPAWNCHTMGNLICGPGHRHPQTPLMEESLADLLEAKGLVIE